MRFLLLNRVFLRVSGWFGGRFQRGVVLEFYKVLEVFHQIVHGVIDSYV